MKGTFVGIKRKSEIDLGKGGISFVLFLTRDSIQYNDIVYIQGLNHLPIIAMGKATPISREEGYLQIFKICSDNLDAYIPKEFIIKGNWLTSEQLEKPIIKWDFKVINSEILSTKIAEDYTWELEAGFQNTKFDLIVKEGFKEGSIVYLEELKWVLLKADHFIPLGNEGKQEFSFLDMPSNAYIPRQFLMKGAILKKIGQLYEKDGTFYSEYINN